MKSAVTTNNKAIISSKGQVVIPKALREKLGIHAGNQLIFEIRSNGVLEMKPVKRSIEQFFGRCKKPGKTSAMSTKQMDEAIEQAVSSKENLKYKTYKTKDKK